MYRRAQAHGLVWLQKTFHFFVLFLIALTKKIYQLKTSIKLKLEIIKKRQEGETWTAIAEWMENETGISVHRSTIQRWYDKEGDYVEGGDSKLEKQVDTYKNEAEHYKKLYEQASDEISTHQSIVDIIQTVTKPFKEQALVKAYIPDGKNQ